MTTYNIGVEATMQVIGGKWKAIILCHLRNQTMRTGELRRAIPQITQKCSPNNCVNLKMTALWRGMFTNKCHRASIIV